MVITARSPNGDKKIVLKQSSCGYFTTSKKDSSRVLFTCCGGYRRANVFKMVFVFVTFAYGYSIGILQKVQVFS